MNSYSENFAEGLVEEVPQSDIRQWCMTASLERVCGETDSPHGMGELSISLEEVQVRSPTPSSGLLQIKAKPLIF